MFLEAHDQNIMISTETPGAQRPKISVCVTAYNHAAYIEKCLGSIIDQDLDVPFEILIGEDQSSDNTAEICATYAARYPDKVRLFNHDRKDNFLIAGRPTGRNNFVHNLKQARGDYIAFCDGDDFWTDPTKLKRQLDAFKAHEGALIAFHKCQRLDETTGRSDYIGDFGREKALIQPEAIIERLGSAMPMNSIMVKRELIPTFLRHCYEVGSMHFYVQALGVMLSPSGALYLPEVMGCLRLNSSGSIRTNVINSKGVKVEWARRELQMLDIVSEYSQGAHVSFIPRLKVRLFKQVLASGFITLAEAIGLYRRSGVSISILGLLLPAAKGLVKRTASSIGLR